MTDPLSPSEARADDLQQRAEQWLTSDNFYGVVEAEKLVRDLLAALVQAEQREADFHMAYRMECDTISKAAIQRAEAAESTVLALRQEIEGLRQQRYHNITLGLELGNILGPEYDGIDLRTVATEFVALKARLSTYEATIRQVEQEIRADVVEGVCGAFVPQDYREKRCRTCNHLKYEHDPRRWADTLQAAILPDERKG
jgi:hypothetical protein